MNNLPQTEPFISLLKNKVDHVIALGNPGAGKSSFLNSILGECVFKSGYSYGSGMTTILQTITRQGVSFSDTPGLSDINTRKIAAQEITKALKVNGLTLLAFVVTLEAGRIRPDDIATAKTILEAIEPCLLQDSSYCVIINKMKKRDINDENILHIIKNCFDSEFTVKPSEYVCLPYLEECDEDNTIYPIDPETMSELVRNRGVNMHKDDVKDISEQRWSENKEYFEKIIDELKVENFKLKEAFELYKKEMEIKLKGGLANLEPKYRIRSGGKLHSKQCHFYDASRAKEVVKYSLNELCLMCYSLN